MTLYEAVGGEAFFIDLVEHFYEAAPDKAKAAREVMAITDYEDFLKESGYGG